MKSIYFIFLISSVFVLEAQDLGNLKNAKPFKISGSASIRGIYMNNGNSLKGGTPLSYMLTGSPTISIYGIDIPLSFVYSPQGKEFHQPFNQYGASPSYKWATVHLGYRNITYNPFSLSGHTIYGAGFDLTPGNWRIGFLFGRLSSATAIDTFSQTLQPVNFTRKGGAVKVGYGTDKNYIELSALSAADDSNSLKVNLSELSTKYGKNITPEGNFVTGLSSRVQFLKHFSVDLNYAISLFTRDLRNPSSIGDPNNNVIKNIFRSLISLNQSTEYYNALQTSLGYTTSNFALKLRFINIEPEYKSMGSYFINSDIQNITLVPSFSLFKKKLSVNSSIGFQRDNLNGLKRTTSNRVIGNFALNAVIGKNINLSTNFSNYSINQTPNISRIADTFRITQTTQNFSFTPVYTLISKTKTQNVVISVNYNKLNDFNNSYTLNNQKKTINTLSSMISYKITKLTNNIGLTFGINRNSIEGSTLNDVNQGGTFGIDKSNKERNFNLGFNNTVLIGKRNNNNTITLSSGLQASLKIKKHNQFSFGNFLNNTNIKSSLSIQNITYFRSDLSYTFIF